jgi:16S rRNA (cytosine967-C5)-methyltransferase
VSSTVFREDIIAYLARYLGRKYAEKLLESVTTPGTRYFFRVNTLKTKPEDLLHELRSQGVNVYQHAHVPEALFVPVEGPFEIRRLDKVVYVDKHTAESVYVGANVFAPGVYKVENAEKGDYVSVISPNGILVAEGILEMEPDEIFSKRRGLAVRVTRSVYKAQSLRDTSYFLSGHIYHQSLPSMVAVRLLNPKPGETILDMCAAPGGKSTHAAQLMENTGEIIAVDRSKSKVDIVLENAKRLGINIIKGIVYDSRYISEVLGKESVDAVILDPPCSALGVRPKLYYDRSYQDIVKLANYQRQFIREAVNVLRRGGKLLYTTCTFSPLENELNVVHAFSDFGLTPVPISFPSIKTPLLGIPGLQFDPHLHDTPGFFISILVKK